MKKFYFDLQKILDYRNFEKQQAESELAQSLSVENEINEKLKYIAGQYASSKSMIKGSLNFDDVVSQSRYKNLLNYQKEELLKQLAEAKLITEQKREVLRQCMKKTTALEKLRDNQKEEWNAAADYEEAELLDDIKSKTKL